MSSESDTSTSAEPNQRLDPAVLRTSLVLVLGTFIATLDATIVNVGIDTLHQQLQASLSSVAWISTGYLLAVAVTMPTAGWAVDRFGGRRVWTAALALFLLGSLLCGLASSTTSLVIFRVLQGLGGGLLPPVGQSLVARRAGPASVGKVMSIVAIVPMLSPVIGPIVGGLIIGGLSWHWLFFINLPIGALALALSRRYVPAGQPQPGVDKRPDITGMVLLSPGLAGVVFGFSRVNQPGGFHRLDVVLPLIAGVLLLAGYAVHALRSRRTVLIDLRLFADPAFRSATATLFLFGASIFGSMFLLPLYYQQIRGSDALNAGLLLAPQGIGAALASLLVGRIVRRYSAQRLVTTGMVLAVLGTAIYTQVGPETSIPLLAVSLVVRGFGMGMTGAPVMTAIYGKLDRAIIPRASSALTSLNQIGGSLGTAVLAIILQSNLAEHSEAPASAYAHTFWWVLGFCLIAVLVALTLPRRAPDAEQHYTA